MNQTHHVRRVITSNNYYEVLGIARDASSKDIKKAYREMALKYHPDKNSIPCMWHYHLEAKEVFNKVVNSYNVLSDEARRKNHDAEISKPSQPQVNHSQK